MDYRDIIRIPSVTEKNNLVREKDNVFVFQVHPEANKIEIRKAVEAVFKVKVSDVRTQNVHGKLKRMGKTEGRRSSWKKAIVKLKPGNTIQIFEGA
jgi:large subunit ribosomal protein L23